MRRLWALVACAAVLALGGCGGGGESDPASTTATQATTSTTTHDSASVSPPSQQSAGGQKELQAQKPDQGSAKQGGKGDDSSPNAVAPVKPPRVSSAPVAGAKTPAPGVKTVKGADDSVQTYGTESTSSERSEAALALASYLDQRRREDWAGACESLALRPKEQLQKLVKSASAQGKDLGGCAGAMAALGQSAPGSPPPPGTTITEVLSLRGGGDISGDPSYLIYTGPPGQTLYSMPMYFEAGGWKVGLAVPAELPL